MLCGAWIQQSSIVNKHVNLAKVLGGLLKHLCNLIRLGYVGRGDQAGTIRGLCRLLKLGFAAAYENNVCAFAGEGDRDAAPDSRASTGNDGSLAGEASGHEGSLLERASLQTGYRPTLKPGARLGMARQD